ncbi:UNVERIFIED_ORG: hypothetical protein J3A77_000494 [Bacillus sp. PvP124]|nr:hypothetical protein [Bacillus sp. PvP124]
MNHKLYKVFIVYIIALIVPFAILFLTNHLIQATCRK